MTTFALIDQVTRWWDEFSLAEQIFYGIALTAGLVSLILMVLAIFGLEHDGGGIFSVEPLTGFFLGFGWIGGFSLGRGRGKHRAPRRDPGGRDQGPALRKGHHHGWGVGGQNASPGQFVQDLYKGVLPIQELAKSVGLKSPGVSRHDCFAQDADRAEVWLVIAKA